MVVFIVVGGVVDDVVVVGTVVMGASVTMSGIIR